ncbi:MAG: hypothetical protein RR363_04015 [Rikenellaceae bacterium]
MIKEYVFNKAVSMGACALYTGKEDMNELARLFFTPQGQEFCVNHNFPDYPTFQMLKSDEFEQEGIYIDEDVRLANKAKVGLIGDTYAELVYTDPNKRHEVILMYGAKAKIVARDWAVVFVTNAGGGEVVCDADDTAKIMML